MARLLPARDMKGVDPSSSFSRRAPYLAPARRRCRRHHRAQRHRCSDGRRCRPHQRPHSPLHRVAGSLWVGGASPRELRNLARPRAPRRRSGQPTRLLQCRHGPWRRRPDPLHTRPPRHAPAAPNQPGRERPPQPDLRTRRRRRSPQPPTLLMTLRALPWPPGRRGRRDHRSREQLRGRDERQDTPRSGAAAECTPAGRSRSLPQTRKVTRAHSQAEGRGVSPVWS